MSENLERIFDAIHNNEEIPERSTPMKQVPVKEPLKVERRTLFAERHSRNTERIPFNIRIANEDE